MAFVTMHLVNKTVVRLKFGGKGHVKSGSDGNSKRNTKSLVYGRHSFGSDKRFCIMSGGNGTFRSGCFAGRGNKINEDAFKEFHENWNANVIRLAMYTAESGAWVYQMLNSDNR